MADKSDLKKKLTPIQFSVTQEDGTEPPFNNEFWNNHAAGLYVDVVSGEPLFTSLDKFDSGCGWPSFTKPVAGQNVVEKSDSRFFMRRTEVRSKGGDSHLGHVFDDGPDPTGLRYCINSASLRFVPVARLAAEGYGEFAKLFEGDATGGQQDKAPGSLASAVFAGGCFWCMEPPFEQLAGVKAIVSGYTGGKQPNPTYEDVCTGRSGHIEAIRVDYDPARVTYEQLLDAYWRSIDPTDSGGQFADRGSQYRPAIFVKNAEQRALAEKSKRDLDASGTFDRPVVSEILEETPFYPAEDYHQGYAKKNPSHYKQYSVGSGRQGFLERIWGKK